MDRVLETHSVQVVSAQDYNSRALTTCTLWVK